MELSALIPTAQPLPVFLPNGDDTGIVLQVVGKESTQFFDASTKWTTHVQERNENKMTLKEMKEMQADLLASLIVGWSGLTENGSPLPYSHATAVRLMDMPELTFLRNAVEEFASDRTNFFRSSKAATTALSQAAGEAQHPKQRRRNKAAVA